MIKSENNALRRIISLLLLATLAVTYFPVQILAMDNNSKEILELVNLAEEEREKYGEATDPTINNLQIELEKRGIDTGSYSEMQYIEYEDGSDLERNNGIMPRGYGEIHKINKTWSYRVDKPTAGDAKPHVHVYKNGKQVGVENVDGTSSHGKTLKKVPKNIKEKVRNSKDYKKGKSDLKKMKQAKSEIKRKHLNLKNAKDLLIAAGIFVAIVGVAFFAPEVLPAALLMI